MPDTELYCCPFCGWWRPARYGIDQRTGEPREVRFDKVDPATAPMYRVQRLSGAGRGSPDAIVKTIDSKGLQELPEEMKQQMREQAHKILDVLGEKKATKRKGVK